MAVGRGNRVAHDSHTRRPEASCPHSTPPPLSSPTSLPSPPSCFHNLPLKFQVHWAGEEKEEQLRSTTMMQEDAKAALGTKGSRPFSMHELLGEIKEAGEAD